MTKNIQFRNNITKFIIAFYMGIYRSGTEMRRQEKTTQRVAENVELTITLQNIVYGIEVDTLVINAKNQYQADN